MSGFDLSGYVTVAERLRLALEKWPDLRVQETEPTVVEIDGRRFVQVRTTVWRGPDDPLPSVATSWEPWPGLSPYTKNSEVENASTSALGRALGLMGIGIRSSIASADEVRNRSSERAPAPGPKPRPTPNPVAQVDSDGPNAASTPPQRVLLEKLLKDAGRPAMTGTELEELSRSAASALITELKTELGRG